MKSQLSRNSRHPLLTFLKEVWGTLSRSGNRSSSQNKRHAVSISKASCHPSAPEVKGKSALREAPINRLITQADARVDDQNDHDVEGDHECSFPILQKDEAFLESVLSDSETLPRTMTQREQQILELIWAGFKSKEISQRLKISVKTIEAHRASKMKKMCVSNTAQLLRSAMEAGLIKQQ